MVEVGEVIGVGNLLHLIVISELVSTNGGALIGA